MGGLFAYLAAEATTAIKRKATVYGLMAVGGLILVFAAGYALNAVYTLLMFRLGGVIASLIIAGGLLAVAVACVVAGVVVGNRPVRSPDSAVRASPHSHAPYRKPYSSERVIAVVAGAAGALSTAFAIIKSKRVRDLLRGRRPSKMPSGGNPPSKI